MRFASYRPTPAYSPRREQRRLLTLVVLLGLVMFLMHQASKPASWNWFLLLANQPVAGPAASGEIDTRLRPAVETVPVAGAFTSPIEHEALAPAPGERFPGVRPELLASVRDDTFFRAAEQKAFFHLLEILRDTNQAVLETASTGPVAFAQLYQQPAEYRGKLVQTRGRVRRVEPITSARNESGIESYYRVWLQPSDNPTVPLAIYTLELPERFPVAENVQEDVELTGFFFNRWAYRAQDSIRTAPLLLAKTVRWHQPVVASHEPVQISKLLAIVACALVLTAIVVYMARQSSGATYAGARPRFRVGGNVRNEPSPEEILKALAERAEADSAAAPDNPRPGSQGSLP